MREILRLLLISLILTVFAFLIFYIWRVVTDWEAHLKVPVVFVLMFFFVLLLLFSVMLLASSDEPDVSDQRVVVDGDEYDCRVIDGRIILTKKVDEQ